MTTAGRTPAAAKSISAGCWKGAPSKTCGSCRASSTARRCESTIQTSTPGTSSGAIRSKQRYRRQIGRAHGDDIVQEGNDDTGAAVRWSFTEITPTSFRWRGEHSPDGGANWQLQAEYFARRVNS